MMGIDPMTEEQFPAGTVIFRPGDLADAAYLIHAGHVEILAGSRRVAVLGPKDVFGEVSLLEARPRGSTARAMSAVIAVGLTADEFERVLADPDRRRRYLRGLYSRLGNGRTGVTETPAPLPDPGSPTVADARKAPPVILFPLTPRAASVVPDTGLPVLRFPFRIGRPSDDAPGLAIQNDLWLPDEKPYNVSRGHAAIELAPDGTVVVRDRGSQLGCLVNDAPLGGPFGGRLVAQLTTGPNVLVIGSNDSPYRFRATVGVVIARG
jgi:hypothetical protein